jgi:hypothetical protein
MPPLVECLRSATNTAPAQPPAAEVPVPAAEVPVPAADAPAEKPRTSGSIFDGFGDTMGKVLAAVKLAESILFLTHPLSSATLRPFIPTSPPSTDFSFTLLIRWARH